MKRLFCKTKRPSWATSKNRRWKIVDSNYESPIQLFLRSTTSKDRGTILTYSYNTIVISPNGVNRNPLIECAAGIHAYTSRQRAITECHTNQHVLIVYAPQWWGLRKYYKQRAAKIFVGNQIKVEKK